ncbi:unknown [Spodoptera litura nucleopolyhedrovirus]|uniref:Uncharacterized protein n=1 Tax=Spodoptera litura multicapsid nucleopolyhedrovirus TaxID=46242 RepID=Q91BH2_NPVST|nr:hypothetical protein [Spodoptera litura nucleopolyhedrovirus]AAL01826.1 unknown [Spodoptera litura nucleopolyhedrovirus]
MYASISELPKSVDKLPYHGKRIFMKVFNSAHEQYGNEQSAFRAAWSAVKRKYIKRKGRWVARRDANDYDTTDTDTTTDTDYD